MPANLGNAPRQRPPTWVRPVTGTVRDRNDDLARTPELVNTDPYGRGWLFEAEIGPTTLDRQLAALLDVGAYRALAGA
jgi:glycine cleavage system H protein